MVIHTVVVGVCGVKGHVLHTTFGFVEALHLVEHNVLQGLERPLLPRAVGEELRLSHHPELLEFPDGFVTQSVLLRHCEPVV